MKLGVDPPPTVVGCGSPPRGARDWAGAQATRPGGRHQDGLDGVRGSPEHPLVGLQRTAGNRAVSSMITVQRDGPPGPGTGGTAGSGGGGAAAGQTTTGGTGTIAAPPTTQGVSSGDSGVSPEAQLASDGNTVTLTVVAHNFNVHSPGPLDILHEPGISIQVTPGNAPQPVVQAAIAALNLHIQSHGHDLVELSLSPQGQAGPGGVGASVQAQAELHITATFSITASSTLSVTGHSDTTDPSQVRVAGNRSVDLLWQPISIGTLFHFGSDGAPPPHGAPVDYAAVQADAKVISWVTGQLSRGDFTPPGQEALEVDTIVTQLYDAMRGAGGDTVDWMMHGMPPANQLPPGLSNGLRRAAELLVQANPGLGHIRLVRVNVLTARDNGGEQSIRWIPITLESAAVPTG